MSEHTQGVGETLHGGGGEGVITPPSTDRDAGFFDRLDNLRASVYNSLNLWLGTRNDGLIRVAIKAAAIYREAIADPDEFYVWCGKNRVDTVVNLEYDFREPPGDKNPALTRVLAMWTVKAIVAHGDKKKGREMQRSTRAEWASCIGYIGTMCEGIKGEDAIVRHIVDNAKGITGAAKAFRDKFVTPEEAADRDARAAKRKATLAAKENPPEMAASWKAFLECMQDEAAAVTQMDKLREAVKSDMDEAGVPYVAPPDDLIRDDGVFFIVGGDRYGPLPGRVARIVNDAILATIKADKLAAEAELVSA